MGCFKTLTLSGECELETCVDASKVSMGTDVVNESGGLAFASDLCYCAVLSRNAAQTELYVSKYEPASNTLVKKVTIAGSASSNFVYDSSKQKFVFCGGSTVYTFDPSDNTIASFNSGITSLFEMVYVPQHNRIYGEFGLDGGGNTYIGYIDLDLNIIVQLGIIPDVGPSKPRPYNLIYVPSVNSLYGCWATGFGTGLAKFELTGNTGNGSVTLGANGIDICLDTDRNRIIIINISAQEVDPATDTMVFSGPIPNGPVTWTPFYSSTLKKVIGAAYDFSVDGGPSVMSYNTLTQTTAVELNNYPEGFREVCELSDGSIMTASDDDVSNVWGVHRLCIT